MVNFNNEEEFGARAYAEVVKEVGEMISKVDWAYLGSNQRYSVLVAVLEQMTQGVCINPDGIHSELDKFIHNNFEKEEDDGNK